MRKPKVQLHITKNSVELLAGELWARHSTESGSVPEYFNKEARRLLRSLLKLIKVTINTEHKHSCLYCEHNDGDHRIPFKWLMCECSCGAQRATRRGSWERLK